MALTNNEKRFLRDKVKRLVRLGYIKKDAIECIVSQNGFKKSTVNAYWKTFSEGFWSETRKKFGS